MAQVSLSPILADLLPPRVRDWTYALMGMVNGGYLVYEAVEGSPLWVKIVLGALNAGGFMMAKGNINAHSSMDSDVQSNVASNVESTVHSSVQTSKSN